MTRRNLWPGLIAVLSPAVAQAQFTDSANDFAGLINAFTRQWNLCMNMVIDGKWDLKIAEDAVKKFDAVTGHPAWLMRHGKAR